MVRAPGGTGTRIAPSVTLCAVGERGCVGLAIWGFAAGETTEVNPKNRAPMVADTTATTIIPMTCLVLMISA